jgi:hypothetical protein
MATGHKPLIAKPIASYKVTTTAALSKKGLPLVGARLSNERISRATITTPNTHNIKIILLSI